MNGDYCYCSSNITTETVRFLTILSLLQLTKYVKTLENICELCAKSLFNCYTFIQTCNSNASLLTNALDGLNSGIQNICKPEAEQSLFVSINLENFTSQLLYDNQHIFTSEMALKRFKFLKIPKMKKEYKPKGKTNKYGFKNSDILHDSGNRHIFQCKLCLKMYQSMLKLRNHFTRVHIEKSQICYKHQRSSLAHQTGSSRMTCKICGETYSSLSLLKYHQTHHKNTIVCQDCGRTYKNKSTFKNHLQLDICKQERRHSPLEAKYTCDYCDKKYTQKMSLRVHIQFEHGNYKAHICEWCGKKFWAQSRLKAHIVKHTRERNFICHTCHQKFVTKESLLYHTRLHTGDKPYKCPECSSRFLSASRRSDHVKRYHNNAKPGLECDMCHGKFRTESVLNKHKKTHEEKPYTNKSTRINHIQVDRSKSKNHDKMVFQNNDNTDRVSKDNFFFKTYFI